MRPGASKLPAQFFFAMEGRIVQISMSAGGVPKRPVSRARITSLGLEGDLHAHPHIHGGPEKAVLLIAAEAVEALRGAGWPVYYGALGENLTTLGLDFRLLRVGQQLRAGTSTLEISRLRTPCSTLDVYGPGIQKEIYDAAVKSGDASSPRWGLAGFYARVLEPGEVFVQDIISLEATPA
jgi:MOSC domain-containing protein YiiM